MSQLEKDVAITKEENVLFTPTGNLFGTKTSVTETR
jgi:hypothetical protein